jgi:hypothetical protein
MMLLALNRVYYWRYKSNTHKHYNWIIKTKFKKRVWKLFIKVIKGPSKVGLGLNKQIALIKKEAQALVFRGESKECFTKVHIDNQTKIVIVYLLLKFVTHGRKKLYNIGKCCLFW